MRLGLSNRATDVRIWLLRRLLGGRFDPTRAFVVTSAPRSGSTLLARMLTSMGSASVLFEPLNLRDVPEAAAAGFDWSTYRGPGTRWSDGEIFLRRVFEGRIINPWTARELSLSSAVRAQRLIVKFVRANQLLPWLCERFRLPAPILLIRHPCAVVASQLGYGWRGTLRPDCPAYLAPYPGFRAVLANTGTQAAHLAASWCLEYLPAFLTPQPAPWLLLTYEGLLLQPRAALTRIGEHWGVRFDMEKVMAIMDQPSSTVSSAGIRGLNGWRQVLSPAQVSSIHAVVQGFGLCFYGDADGPDEARLYAPDLAARLHAMGSGPR